MKLDDVIRIADNHLLLDRCTGKRLYCTYIYHSSDNVEIKLSEESLSEVQQKQAEWYMEYEAEGKDGTPLLRLNARIGGKPAFAGAVYLSPDNEILDKMLFKSYD